MSEKFIEISTPKLLFLPFAAELTNQRPSDDFCFQALLLFFPFALESKKMCIFHIPDLRVMETNERRKFSFILLFRNEILNLYINTKRQRIVALLSYFIALWRKRKLSSVFCVVVDVKPPSKQASKQASSNE